MGKLPDLEGLAIFAKVVELRSFARTAEELQLSKELRLQAAARVENDSVPLALPYPFGLIEDNVVLLCSCRDAGDEIGAIEGHEREPEKPIFEDVRPADWVALAIDASVSLRASGNGVLTDLLRVVASEMGSHSTIMRRGLPY